jgi:zinc protease
VKLLLPLILAAALLPAAAQTPKTPAPKAPALPSYKDLKFPPLRPIVLPKPETFTLPNGMKVYLLENHELPLVSGFALVRTGNLFDPPGKHGLADITGGLIRSGGTKDKTGDQLDVELEDVAASVESGIGETSGSVSFNCLKENTAEVLGVFHDVLTQPGFRQDKLELAKTQWRSAIARRNDDASGIAAREFANIVYGKNTPYGWDVNYSDIDAIDRSDVQAFYSRYFFPANVMLAVYGDFSTAEMKAQLEKLFADWTVKQDPVPPFPKVTAKPMPGIFLAAKDDVAQTFFQMGLLGGELRDKDFPALSVASDILGGGFFSRLFLEVRTRLGYAYSIGASWNADYDHPGLFRISGSTQSKDTVATLAAVEAEVQKMRTSEVTQQELDEAKGAVLNSFVFAFDRPSKTLNRMLTYEYFGYPRDFIFEYQKAVANVTRADVLRVARQYFTAERFTIVAVGNPKDFGTPLSKLGVPIHPIDLTIPEPKAETAKSSSATLAQGKALLARMQTALGGVGKLTAVKDTSYEADVKIDTGGPPMTMHQNNTFVAPGALRQDLVLPFGKQSVFSDGKTGWMSSPRGTGGLSAPLLKQVRGELFRQLYSLALSDHDPDRTVNAVDGHTLEISNKDGESVRIELDPSTGLPAKILYDGMGMGGPAKVEETYSNWKDIDGLKAPFSIEITQNGKKFAGATITSFKINSGLTLDQISKKP